MSTSALSKTTVVFQGEYAVIQREGVLKTSTPTTCHVVTVYDRASKKAFLTHIDDYTSVPDTIQKVVDQFATSRPIEIKLLGGGSDLYSRRRFKEISSTLGALNLPFEKLHLRGYYDRPQIILDGETGQITLLEGEEKNQKLELIQKRKYGVFNDFLDRDYGDLKGTDIPNFAVKLAQRQESDMFCVLPQRAPLVKEREKQILLELLEKIIQQEDAPLPIRPFQENNLNFYVRLACSDSKHLPLLIFLLTFKSDFNIDLQNRGKTSGTAFDVAEKANNRQALELLQNPGKTPLDIVQEQSEALTGGYGSPQSLLAPQVDGDWNLLFSRVSANPDYFPSFKLLSDHMDLLKIDIQTALQCAISEFAPGLQPNATNYPLLFRQSAQNPSHLPLLYFLANNRDLLKLDIHARGKTSGSALDIAVKANNISAVAFLRKLGLEPPCSSVINVHKTVAFAQYDNWIQNDSSEVCQNMRKWIAVRTEGKVYAISRKSQGDALADHFDYHADPCLVEKFKKFAATSNAAHSQENPLIDLQAMDLATRISDAYEKVKNTPEFRIHNALLKEMIVEMEEGIRVTPDLMDLFFRDIKPALVAVDIDDCKTKDYIAYKLGYVKAFGMKAVESAV